MAANIYGGVVTVTGTAQSVYDLLLAVDGLPPNLSTPLANSRATANVVIIRAALANAGVIYTGSKNTVDASNDFRTTFLMAGEGITRDAVTSRIDIKALWLVASTPGDEAFIECVEY